MRPRLFFLTLIIALLACSAVSAQEDTSRSHLRVPLAEDRVAQAEAVVAAADTIYTSWDTAGTAEPDALADEIHWRLIDPSSINYAQLLSIYRAMAHSAATTVVDDRFIPPLIELWLADHCFSSLMEMSLR